MKFTIPYETAGLLQDDLPSSANTLPLASSYAQIAHNFNHAACLQRKVFASYHQYLGALEVPTDTAYSTWPFYCLTGEGTDHISFVMLVASANSATPGFSASTASSFRVSLREYGVGSVTTPAAACVHEDSASSAVTPGGCYFTIVKVSVNPNTAYYGSILCTNGARILSLTVAEGRIIHADPTTNGVTNPSAFIAGGPIYTSQIEDLISANNSLWRHNATHLVAHVPGYDYDTAGNGWATVSSTTYTNIIDATTAVASTSLGFVVENQYHGTVVRAANAIPVRMVVLAERVSGSANLRVRFTDGTNTITLTTSGAGSAPLADAGVFTLDTTMIAQAETKYDIHASLSTASGSWKIYYVGLLEYEA